MSETGLKMRCSQRIFDHLIFILIFELQMLLLQPLIHAGEVPEWPKGTVC
jgi:hypothetical protein